ncbi:MAG: class I SAM-dependent methyltransferase [Pseudomonadota bacterium]
MSYSRSNPSPRYTSLVAMYREMHFEGEKFLGIPPEKTFPGQSLPPHAGRIKTHIDRFGAKTLLDYGCGKGLQYRPQPVNVSDGRTFNSIPEFWGVAMTLYDPAYTPYSTLPQGKFDGVISTDVLEHCPEDDVDWIVDEIFSYATKFVYANVACYPASKRLPNGENAHTTIKPIEYWTDVFNRVALKHGNLPWTLVIDERVTEDGQMKAKQSTVTNIQKT